MSTHAPALHVLQSHDDPSTAAARGRLHRIPVLVGEILGHGGKLPRGRYVSDRVTTKSHDAPPSPAPAIDEEDVLRSWAAGWADTVAALLDEPEHRDHRLLMPSLAYLEARLERVMAGPLAELLLDDLASMVDRLTELAGLEAFAAKLPTPCVRCDRRSLVREDGTGLVRCTATGCGASWPHATYRRMVDAVARRARRARSAS